VEPQIGHPSADSGTPQIRSSERRDRTLKRSLRRLKPCAPFFALIALSLLIGAANPRFFEFNNLIRVANSAAIPLVLALGMTFVIVLGSIDLSVEGVLAIGAVLISLLVQNNSNALDLAERSDA
jgi:ribose/xylose/arabinose/galactoside ABC-type transport system permease subunit